MCISVGEQETEMDRGTQNMSSLCSQRYLYSQCCPYLVKVFRCGSHLLPGFVEQLDADAEELFKRAVMSKEHWVEVMAVLTGCGGSGHSVNCQVKQKKNQTKICLVDQ